MLAITGARPDGFHSLVSVAAPTRFGDVIRIEEAGEDSVECAAEGVPLDGSNLVMKAAGIFRKASGMERFFKFSIEKRVPHGAGLGGGSSNGAVALGGINEMCGSPLDSSELSRLAALMGSDCPLFLSGRPVVMRGRGELVSDLPEVAADVLSSLKILIFKPAFSINTGWAYGRMRERGSWYVSEREAEAMLSAWLEDPRADNIPLFNNMQGPAFEKYPALEAAVEFVRSRYGVPAVMSGSGSACFAIINSLDAAGAESLKADVLERLGPSCFAEYA